MRDTVIVKNNIKSFVETKQDTNIINVYFANEHIDVDYRLECWGFIFALLVFTLLYFFKKPTVINNNNHNDMKSINDLPEKRQVKHNSFDVTYQAFVPIEEINDTDYLKNIKYDDSNLINEKING